MYPYEERIKAVELYIKYNHNLADTINELGYPTRQMITRVSSGINSFSIRRYAGLVKSFTDCLSRNTFPSNMPKSRIATSCLSSFCRRVDTQQYPYSVIFTAPFKYAAIENGLNIFFRAIHSIRYITCLSSLLCTLIHCWNGYFAKHTSYFLV